MNASFNARIVDLSANHLLMSSGHCTQCREHGIQQVEPRIINRLQTVLQTSIELPEILKLFYLEMRVMLHLQGLSFLHDAYRCEYQFGDSSLFHSHYRLQTENDYLGELNLYRSRPFSEQEHCRIDLLLNTLIYPIRNGLRYRDAVTASMTDGLTGVGNRIKLDSMLTQAIGQAQRYEQPLSLLILDLDHFKHINDQFGHRAGDHVLKSVASTIEDTARCADMTFRFGGEEFVILLNKTDAGGASISAERIRKKIEAMALVWCGTRIQVTASIGAASLGHDETREQFLERADMALYKAKTDGRNQVKVAEPSLANA